MGEDVPTVTKSSRPRIVSRHLDPPTVEPINAGQVKAHYVGRGVFTVLQWTPGILTCVIILTLAWGFIQVRNTLAYANVGRQLCEQPIMTQTAINCAGTTLDCLTDPVVMAVNTQNAAIHDHNVFRARHCLRV